MMKRLALAGLLLAQVALLTAGRWDYTQEETWAAFDGASSLMWCIVERESEFKPWAVGDNGLSFGPGQLYTYGELPTFRAMGFTDPFSPPQTRQFMQIRFDQGGAPAWTGTYWGCVRDGATHP